MIQCLLIHKECADYIKTGSIQMLELYQTLDDITKSMDGFVHIYQEFCMSDFFAGLQIGHKRVMFYTGNTVTSQF